MKLMRLNRDLLSHIARQNQCDYADAYAVWLKSWRHSDVYPFIDTVLWIARIHRLPVDDAMELVEGVEEQVGQ